ncbi:cyanophycinase [bacterium]|nr:cyanophycinase [bacterium]
MLQRSAVLMGVLTAVVGLGARPACGQQEPMPGWLDLTARWETLGPPRGTLMICGGVYHVSDFARFLALAGGPDARIVLIPTARPDYAARADFTAPHELRKAGARHVVVLHTMDRAQADSDAFVAPLREASGVWFSGGDQKHLGRVYVHTRAHTEILRLLDRGGVVGGNSAGASIQGSYLYGGGRELPDGLGLVRESVIGQHYFRRNRHDSLTSYLARRPELLGLGIGEWAGVQVRGDEMEVFGRGKVAVADASAAGWPELPYRELVAGDQYRLGARAATHQQVWAASDHWRSAPPMARTGRSLADAWHAPRVCAAVRGYCGGARAQALFGPGRRPAGAHRGRSHGKPGQRGARGPDSGGAARARRREHHRSRRPGTARRAVRSVCGDPARGQRCVFLSRRTVEAGGSLPTHAVSLRAGGAAGARWGGSRRRRQHARARLASVWRRLPLGPRVVALARHRGGQSPA